MSAGTRRMLIVDDEQAVCQSLSQFFSVRGFEVATAFSGEEAITHLKQSPIDVVLIDILLPGIHGLEVLRRAKELHPAAHAVMMTGLPAEALQQEARRSGADAFISKPFDLSDVTWSSVLGT